MIIGIGCDLANINRIEEGLNKFGNRFMQRFFTENEIVELQKKSSQQLVGAMAKKFAAKEACSKALGTGISEGISWKDIEITHLSSGQPIITLHKKAREKAEKLSSGKKINIMLSLSDDYPWAQAFVIIDVQV